MARSLRSFPLVVVVSAASLLTLIWLGFSLKSAYEFNRKLEAQTLQSSAAPDAIFADAVYWGKHGDMPKSQMLYAQLASTGDLALRKAALYNSGNLYLDAAYEMLEDRGLEVWDQANPLLSLAKERYREVMRLDPGWREAKYNYQLALRLSPIFEGKYSRKEGDEDSQEKREYVEGWPSIPGFPRGMP